MVWILANLGEVNELQRRNLGGIRGEIERLCCWSIAIPFGPLCLSRRMFCSCFDDNESDAFDSDDDNDVPHMHFNKNANSVMMHAFLSFQRGIMEDGRDVMDVVSEISSSLKARGLRTISEQDKLNIEGIGLAKSMVLFVTQDYLSQVNYGLDKELVRRYIKRQGENKHIVIVLEERMRAANLWKDMSPLGEALAGHSFIDMVTILDPAGD